MEKEVTSEEIREKELTKVKSRLSLTRSQSWEGVSFGNMIFVFYFL